MSTTETSPQTAAVEITLNGASVSALPGELLISAAERAGVFIPRFCYHPRMDPVGMCRMCLVEVSGPRGPSLQPACFLRVSDGLEVETESVRARKAQEGVLEFLLVNHPLDCPVCDKGGECPLQDQALAYGPGETRFIEEKRHFAKPIEIGPLVALDRERCIQCARCTRFAAELAGEAQIDFASRGDAVEVATFPTQPFSSYFSGNTVQICPVGALTAIPYRFRSRPWDLEQVESTCTACSFGCRIAAQSSAGRLVRNLGIDSDPVNQSWLCDKGRFSYEAVHASSRLTEPLVRKEGELRPARWHEAIGEVTAGIRWALERGGPSEIAFIGGARFANEDAYAFAKLAKSVIGTDSVDAQLGDGLSPAVVLGLPRATIDEAASAPVVLLLSGDLREELPVFHLRLREAVVGGKTRLVECSTLPSALSSLATVRLSHAPGEAARVCQALVAGNVPGDIGGVPGAEILAARELLSTASSDGAGVVIVVGRANLAESAATLTAAATLLAKALPRAKFLPALRRANVNGALDMGLAPGLLPGRVSLDAGRAWFEAAWGAAPAEPGRDAISILQAAASGELTTLVLLGADPLRDCPDRTLASAALEAVPFLCAIGTHVDSSNKTAHVVLPVAGDAERTGTTTNVEGRVTRLAEKVVAPALAWPAWSVACEIAHRLGADLGFGSVHEISAEISRVAPAYLGVSLELLGRGGLHDGVVVPLTSIAVDLPRTTRRIDPIGTPGIASVESQGAPLYVGAPLGEDDREDVPQPGRPALLGAPDPEPVTGPGRLDAYSYRLVVRRRLYDAGTLVSSSPSLAPLCASAALDVHPHELERLGIVEGETLRLRRGERSVELVARADESLPRSLVVATMNVTDAVGPMELIDAVDLAVDVHLETI